MSTQLNQIYKCEICGNIVEVVHAGSASLVCCGKPMTLMDANTVDAAVEKHVPVVTSDDQGVKIAVGSVAHPMTEEHYIEWIEIASDACVRRCNLKPGETPEARFCKIADGDTVRAYCNLHGLWKA